MISLNDILNEIRPVRSQRPWPFEERMSMSKLFKEPFIKTYIITKENNIQINEYLNKLDGDSGWDFVGKTIFEAGKLLDSSGDFLIENISHVILAIWPDAKLRWGSENIN